eukprot:3438473-Rhodomonas_salina.2
MKGSPVNGRALRICLKYSGMVGACFSSCAAPTLSEVGGPFPCIVELQLAHLIRGGCELSSARNLNWIRPFPGPGPMASGSRKLAMSSRGHMASCHSVMWSISLGMSIRSQAVVCLVTGWKRAGTRNSYSRWDQRVEG